MKFVFRKDGWGAGCRSFGRGADGPKARTDNSAVLSTPPLREALSAIRGWRCFFIKNRRARPLAKPGSRGVLTGAVALGSVLVAGDRRHRHVDDLPDRQLVHVDVRVRLLHVQPVDPVQLADAGQVLAGFHLVLPHAAGVGRGLRGGRGLRRLRVRGGGAVAVVGDEAHDHERHGHGREGEVDRRLAVPGHEAEEDRSPLPLGPAVKRADAAAEGLRRLDEAAGVAVDAHVLEIAVRQAVGVGGGGGRGEDGFVHEGLQGPRK